MTLWLNTFSASIVLFILSYLTNLGLVSDIPAVLILVASILTVVRTLRNSNMTVAQPIAFPFIIVLLLAIVFVVKQIFQSGTYGAVLASKILLYHLTFMTGLLIGHYGRSRLSRNAWSYVAIIIALPLFFFIVFAKHQPPSDALSVFNRNSFAGYTLTASALLLGFGTNRPIIALPVYIAVVCLTLLINTTLGALLAFLIATIAFFGPQIFRNVRFLVSGTVAGVLGAGMFLYINTNPEALEGIETINRLRFVAGTFGNLFGGYEGSWLELDMGTAVRFAANGELDMSAIFRILHWIDIISTRAADGIGAIWIGGGSDWITANRSNFTYNLAAHNEYVRLTVEQGLLYTLVMFALIYAALISVRNNPLFIPLLATTIFLASENLLNNFVATSMYFFIFGHTIAVERRRNASSGHGPCSSNIKKRASVI